MWKQVNPNPLGKSVGDCTIRAISLATDKAWYETYFELCAYGAVMADMPSSNAVSTSYLKRNGFKRKTLPSERIENYSIADFCREHPFGTYILGTGNHLAAVVDGVLLDSWNSENETPVYYFEKGDD